ncbi:MAG: ATP-binding protein [Mycobacterium sp.]
MADALRSLRRFAAEQGIDLDGLDDGVPALHPQGWIMDDPIAWQIETTAANLITAVPPTFSNATVKECPPAVQDFARRHLEDPWAHPWVRMHGGTGRGKTHAAWALIKHFAMSYAEQGRSCDFRFVTNPDLNDELRPKPDNSHAWAIDKYMRCDVLGFDDLGAGNLKDFAIEATLRILNYRYDQRLTSIYTSNLGMRTPADPRYADVPSIQSVFGDRIASRLQPADRIILGGDDRRYDEGDVLS